MAWCGLARYAGVAWLDLAVREEKASATSSRGLLCYDAIVWPIQLQPIFHNRTVKYCISTNIAWRGTITCSVPAPKSAEPWASPDSECQLVTPNYV